MLVIREIKKLDLPQQIFPLSLTIGNFDGVHLGHLKILNQVNEIAAQNNLTSAVLTFEPHPISFFKPQQAKDFRITSLAQKLKIFRAAKIDLVIVLPFNQQIAEISAIDFIKENLIKKLNVKELVVGHDFTFGKNREGNFSLLKKFLPTTEISAVTFENQICSSSLIRKLITSGEIKKANQLLVKNFTISGSVNEGKKLARTLGFPTLNLKAKPPIIKPKFGVYRSSTFLPHLNQTFASITNFGIKPTAIEALEPIFETHIFNFNQNLYGKKAEIQLLDFIREEKKFTSLEELQEQIKADVEGIFIKNFNKGV